MTVSAGGIGKLGIFELPVYGFESKVGICWRVTYGFASAGAVIIIIYNFLSSQTWLRRVSNEPVIVLLP